MKKIQILDNVDMTHLEIIRDTIRKSSSVDIVVAFAKMSGWREIDKDVRRAVTKGVEIRIIVGLDLYITDPEFLTTLFQLSQKNKVQAYVKPEGAYTFHTKLYVFRGGREVSLIIGSANLTWGGLSDNWELSTYIKDSELADQAENYIARLISDEDVVPLSQEIIDDYQEKHAIASAYRGYAAARIARGTISEEKSGIEFFKVRLATFRIDPDHLFDETMKVRDARRAESLSMLQSIAGQTYASPAAFLEDFDRLIDLYNSSSLYRGKSIFAPQWEDIVSLYDFICTGPRQDELLYLETTFQKIETIDRFGVNLLTEPLHSVDNKRFAIMNANSVHGLEKAIDKSYSKFLNKKNINGEIYMRFCTDMLSVMKKLELKNLSELDALFNYFFFNG